MLLHDEKSDLVDLTTSRPNAPYQYGFYAYIRLG